MTFANAERALISRWLAVAMLVTCTLGCSTPTPTHGPSLSAPLSGENEAEISDRFWGSYSAFAPTAFRYDSLAAITADAHLIIRGRVVGTREGERQPVDVHAGEPGERPSTFGVVAIDEVLKGVPTSLVPGSVLVARLGARDQPRDELPKGEVILFLMNYGRLAEEAGSGHPADPIEYFYYARPNGYQCVLRNLDGVVRIVDGPEGWEAALGPFPAPLDGEPFDDVLNTIRQSVAST